MLPSCLLMVDDAGRSSEHDIAELTRGQQIDYPFLHILELYVVAGGYDASLIEAAIELDDNLAVAVVVDFLKFTNVAVLLHDLEELDNDLRRRTDHDLALASLLGIVDALEGIVEDRSASHFDE